MASHELYEAIIWYYTVFFFGSYFWKFSHNTEIRQKIIDT